MSTKHLSRTVACNWCGAIVYRKCLLAHFREGCEKLPTLTAEELVCSMCQKIKNRSEFYSEDGKRGHSLLARCIQCCREYYYLRKQARLQNAAAADQPTKKIVRPGGWVLRPCPFCAEMFSFNQLVHHRPRCLENPKRRKVQETTSNAAVLAAHGMKPNPMEPGVSISRYSNLRRNYGITRDEFEALHAAQDGKCAICQNAPDGSMRERHLHVDHHHGTSKVRGLLCRGCNIGIGNFKESPELLKAAVDYLLKHKLGG